MIYRILFIFFFFFLNNCDQYNQINTKQNKIFFENKFRNIGFTQIYNEKDENFKKNIDNRSLDIFHKSLKKKSQVKIINPNNGKSLIANVKSNKEIFSDFYNSVISPRIAEVLDLDFDEPYIEIILISKNSTFIAKKSKTFEEEKKVAEKAPVDGILINDLNKKKENKEPKKKGKFSYSIKIADFYYKDSALLLVNRIKKETRVKNPKIVKISNIKYRVLIGPFNDIKSIKKSFEEIKSLNFENIEILKNV